MPTLTIIAGPNGSGKSTLTRRLGWAGNEWLLDPDAIARRLCPEDPEKAAIAAGRERTLRTSQYLAAGIDFAIETTFSGRSIRQLIEGAHDRGYAVHLVFVALDNPQQCMARVRDRVATGGHSVPDSDILRRYARSICAFRELVWLVDSASVYDNSGDGHRLILEVRAGKVVWRAEQLPCWAAF
ncbi:MAG TPA: AAA family ATPase [Bryobacteraceae bacterium]|nr:AAA family ATPase [Bryobacteraceae bacterium]